MRMRRAAAAIATAALALGLVGCATATTSHPTGTHGLEQLVSGIPEAGIAEFTNGSGGSWAQHGPVTATVHLQAVSHARLQAIVDELGAFLAQERGGSTAWEVVRLQIGGIRLDVRDRRDENDEAREAYRLISQDHEVTAASIGRYTWVETPSDEIAFIYRQVQRQLEGDVFIGSRGLEADSDDDAIAFSLLGTDAGDRLDDALQAYSGFGRYVTIEGATVTDWELDLTVPEKQFAKARSAARQLGDDFGITVLVAVAASDASTLS